MAKSKNTPQQYKDIHGWFDYEDLYTLIFKSLKTNSHVVEVGCWLGRSACFMAELIKDSTKEIKFDCVDTWRTGPSEHLHFQRLSIEPEVDISAYFKENMKKAGVLKQIKMVQTTSLEAVSLYKDNSLDFVFLDNDHSEKYVFEELIAWWPKIKKGGVLAGHDYIEKSWPGVVKAVNRFAKLKKKKQEVMLHSYIFRK